ncbi:ABC transporter ATP-binding protein [Bacillus aquiflavi]|uniref:ABC transporter ATP-binding protein n=1 Tax=Bacillus aquiflavi TaxID=2672567 RepID=A0A6B3W1I7_9BACI|nr:ABC transporter ATP-binding protein [Bacillus aquiflavi]MBA4537505.1 ABC transporter ATP-binding protein [Bacillus aquiflavi]NEY81761.1 ABC transporter ATP-binding protein [Bacillus aquiflavi]UAC47469.1 ABC transporter ATP-binding protein [Bacillus aquiflavi]
MINRKDSLLEIKGLSFSYGPIIALKKLSFHVNEGEIVALLGANGAGKSTLLKAISGLQNSSSGQIFFYGEDISALPAEQIVKRHLIHVPEHRQVFSTLSVIENMYLGAYHHFKKTKKKKIEKEIKKLFEIFPILEERKNQLAGTLSGGQQQMLAIARAIMAKPKLLLLDEPSLGLAPLLVKEVLELVKVLRDQYNTTILLIEQNVFASLKISDRAYVIQQGEIVKEGFSKELLNDEYVKEAFLGHAVS